MPKRAAAASTAYEAQRKEHDSNDDEHQLKFRTLIMIFLLRTTVAIVRAVVMILVQ